MPCRYRGSTAHSLPSPQYYREILPIPTVITAFPITVSFSMAYPIPNPQVYMSRKEMVSVMRKVMQLDRTQLDETKPAVVVAHLPLYM